MDFSLEFLDAGEQGQHGHSGFVLRADQLQERSICNNLLPVRHDTVPETPTFSFNFLQGGSVVDVSFKGSAVPRPVTSERTSA